MRTYMYTVWLVIVISIFGQECNGMLTVVPKNAAVLEGNEIVLQCRTNSIGSPSDGNTGTLFWRTQLSENHTIMTFHTGNKFAANVSKELYDIINTTKGHFDLKIKAFNTTARKYICEEIAVYNASAELIVLESNPACSRINGSSTSLCLECRLRYFGNWAPVMEWRQVSGEMKNGTKLIRNGITSTTSKYTVVSTLIVQRIEPRSKYTCTTKFNASGRPTLTIASNIPEYSYNWTYSDVPLYSSSSSESLTITASFEQSTETSNFDAVPIICALAGTFLGLGIFLLVALLRKIYCKGGKQIDRQPSNRSSTSDGNDTDFAFPGESQAIGSASVRPEYEEITHDNFGRASELPEHFNEEETVGREPHAILLHVPSMAIKKVASVQRQVSMYCNVVQKRRVKTPPKEEETVQLSTVYINAATKSLPQLQALLRPPIPNASLSKPHECPNSTRNSKHSNKLLTSEQHGSAEIQRASASDEAISLVDDSNLDEESTYVNACVEKELWLKRMVSHSETFIDDIPGIPKLTSTNEDNLIMKPIQIMNEDVISATRDNQETIANVPNYAASESVAAGSNRRRMNYEDLTNRVPLPPPVYACLVTIPNEEN